MLAPFFGAFGPQGTRYPLGVHGIVVAIESMAFSVPSGSRVGHLMLHTGNTTPFGKGWCTLSRHCRYAASNFPLGSPEVAEAASAAMVGKENEIAAGSEAFIAHSGLLGGFDVAHR
jgi:hypothetical protein